jgi:predicted MFS family arabinose efflux permease
VSLIAFVGMVSFVGAPLMWFGARNLTEHSSARESIEDTARLQGRSRYGFLRWPKFWYIALAMMLLAMVHATLINHLLLLLKDRQINADTAVLAASFMGPMQVFGRIVASLVGRYFSNGIITALCFVFSISAVGALILAEQMPAMLAVFIILQGSGIGVSSIMKPVFSREILGGENFGLKSGAQAVPFFIGNAFAALIGSLLWVLGGYDLVLQVLIVLLLIGLGALILAIRANQKTSEV